MTDSALSSSHPDRNAAREQWQAAIERSAAGALHGRLGQDHARQVR